MAQKRGFLVGWQVADVWQVASATGQYWPGVGASHPLVDGMTENDHAQICQAVCWMADDPAARLVTLTADATYRVSWR